MCIESQVHLKFQSSLSSFPLEYIYGINPVLAALSAKRREFDRLYLNITERQEGRESSPHIKQITKMSKNYGIKIKYMAKVRDMLDKFVGEIEQLHDE